MKLSLLCLMLVSLMCGAHAKSDGDLCFYGVINEVVIKEKSVSIVVTGVASLLVNDPSVGRAHLVFSLSRTPIDLSFDDGPKGMHTYSGFRYLDWIDGVQAVDILEKCQKSSSDIRMIIDSDLLTWSKSEGGMRASSLKGTLDEVALWSNLYKEDIAEHTKEMGVRYELVRGVKKVAEQAAPEQPLPAVQSR